MIENRGEKQVESPQSLKPNKQQIQAHQPQQQMKLLEDIFPKALLNNEVWGWTIQNYQKRRRN